MRSKVLISVTIRVFFLEYDNGRIRLSVSTASRTYELSEETQRDTLPYVQISFDWAP